MSIAHALIIDDNAKNVNILARLLEMEGVSSDQLQRVDQLEARLAGVGPADIVFLDLEMPTYNGFAVLAMLRSHPHFAHVPIIAYTVHVSEISVAQQMGFDGFLAKPLDSERFPEQLARLLRGDPVWDMR